MSVEKKMQEIRCVLATEGVKKSGKNDFGKFRYFELEDFLPRIQVLCKEHGLFPRVTIDFETLRGVMTIKDVDDGSEIVFTLPYSYANALNGGKSDIQNIGAATTYIRRYLYMLAFEIAEAEEVDNTANSKASTPKANPQRVESKTLSREEIGARINTAAKRHTVPRDECARIIKVTYGKTWDNLSADDLRDWEKNAGRRYKQVLDDDSILAESLK